MWLYPVLIVSVENGIPTVEDTVWKRKIHTGNCKKIHHFQQPERLLRRILPIQGLSCGRHQQSISRDKSCRQIIDPFHSSSHGRIHTLCCRCWFHIGDIGPRPSYGGGAQSHIDEQSSDSIGEGTFTASFLALSRTGEGPKDVLASHRRYELRLIEEISTQRGRNICPDFGGRNGFSFLKLKLINHVWKKAVASIRIYVYLLQIPFNSMIERMGR